MHCGVGGGGRAVRTAYTLACPDCHHPIPEATLYHQVDVIDPDISNQAMLSEYGCCPDCGDVWLRCASGDF